MGLRVGLTGGLGSGKSTVARMLAELGAYVLSADDLARGLMEPGQAVYQAIVAHFGSEVLLTSPAQGQLPALNRPALARLAFAEGRVAELNQIIHPATIARQEEMTRGLLERDPEAVVVTESALLFETAHGDGWQRRFNQVILVTAPESIRIERFVRRSGWTEQDGSVRRAELEADAKRRLSQQTPEEQKASLVDFVLENNAGLVELRKQVEQLWATLAAAAGNVAASR